jgi:hypothetical protein
MEFLNSNKELVNTVKNIFENKTDETISPAKLKKQKNIEDLSNRLFDYIEPVSWRTELNLAQALCTSERQIKYAKIYLCLTNRITINLEANKNRPNPRHYIVKQYNVQKDDAQKDDAQETVKSIKPQSAIKWEVFNELTPKDFSLMTIEEQMDIYTEMRLPFIPLRFPKFKKDLVYCSCPKGRNCKDIGKHPAVYFKDLDFSKNRLTTR